MHVTYACTHGRYAIHPSGLLSLRVRRAVAERRGPLRGGGEAVGNREKSPVGYQSKTCAEPQPRGCCKLRSFARSFLLPWTHHWCHRSRFHSIPCALSMGRVGAQAHGFRRPMIRPVGGKGGVPDVHRSTMNVHHQPRFKNDER